LGTACTSSTESTVCALRNTGCKDGVCACNLGYKGSVTCSLIVGTSCTAQNEATVCSLENAECKESECACKPGYYGNTCLKIIGSDCSGSAACPGDANAMCKSDKCECKEGYAEKNDVCTQNVDGIDCSNAKTACDNTENAVCDTDNGKCKCKSGYKMDIDKCEMENSAAMTGYGAIVLALSLLASYLMLL
ncbi:cell death abnormality protein 1-like, partial [Ruditapes philippinarum]|uniref:cell death abnormality protein 1-like n=1 Tax=Ruditapes philippinarum TaxID=129788 RepID=UPI00295B3789